MRIFRISFAVLWVIINLTVLGFLLFRQEKTGLCAESYPPMCYNIAEYGWPKPWLNIHENSKANVNEDNARQIALVAAIFFLPSILIAYLAGKGLQSAHPRN